MSSYGKIPSNPYLIAFSSEIARALEEKGRRRDKLAKRRMAIAQAYQSLASLHEYVDSKSYDQRDQEAYSTMMRGLDQFNSQTREDPPSDFKPSVSTQDVYAETGEIVCSELLKLPLPTGVTHHSSGAHVYTLNRKKVTRDKYEQAGHDRYQVHLAVANPEAVDLPFASKEVRTKLPEWHREFQKRAAQTSIVTVTK